MNEEVANTITFDRNVIGISFKNIKIAVQEKIDRWNDLPYKLWSNSRSLRQIIVKVIIWHKNQKKKILCNYFITERLYR